MQGVNISALSHMRYSDDPHPTISFVNTFPRLVGEYLQEFKVSVKEMIGGRENVSSPLACTVKAPLRSFPNLLRRTVIEMVKLIEPANHAHSLADPTLGFFEICITTHRR
jgi:hypothetical protein